MYLLGEIMSSERRRRPTQLARATGLAIREARRALGMSQKELGQLTSIRARTLSRWEHGQSGPTKRNRERLVRAISAHNAHAGAALDSELTRLAPLPAKSRADLPLTPPLAAPSAPPADPAALERAVTACADLMDVSPKRARAFMVEALRAVAASRCSVDDAIALLTAPSSPPAPPVSPSPAPP